MNRISDNGESNLLRVSDEKDQRPHDRFSYEMIPMACCRVDEAGFIRESNEMFAFLFGYETSELEEMLLLDLISGDAKDLIHRVVDGTHRDVGVFSQHLWLKRKDGTSFPSVVNVKLVFDEARRMKYGNIIVIDDTFNYRAIEGIVKDKEELKKKERLKNEFVAIASHELRTPIQPILGFALLAKRGTISQEVAWEGVLAEARRLQQLANDILDVSRIESDNLKYDFVKLKINELIRHTVDSLSTDASKNLAITFNHDVAEKDLAIDADRSRITQVITNIIGNAIKFTSEGRIMIQSKVINDSVEITISDTGGGIPSDILSKLFEKFVTKGHGEGSKKGSGLGLYISKAIVTAHNGDITAFNNNENGATFAIRLPISNSSHKN